MTTVGDVGSMIESWLISGRFSPYAPTTLHSAIPAASTITASTNSVALSAIRRRRRAFAFITKLGSRRSIGGTSWAFGERVEHRIHELPALGCRKAARQLDRMVDGSKRVSLRAIAQLIRAHLQDQAIDTGQALEAPTPQERCELGLQRRLMP